MLNYFWVFSYLPQRLKKKKGGGCTHINSFDSYIIHMTKCQMEVKIIYVNLFGYYIVTKLEFYGFFQFLM